MTRQRSTDLRARMQKVATKPPQHPDAPRPARAARSDRTGAATTTNRRGAATSSRARSAAPRTRQAVADPVVADIDVEPAEPIDVEPQGASRFQTLVGWASWEIIAVPRKRLRFMRDLLLGG